VAAFEQAIAADPSFALAHAGLTQALTTLYSLFDHRAVVAERVSNEAKAAMALDPTRSAVQEAAARADQIAGLLESAERHAREAIHIAPDSDGAHRLLASILASRHDPKGAIDEAQLSVRLRPESAPAQYALGYYNYIAGRYQEAIQPLTRATELQPDLARNFATLGAAYQRLNDFDKAIGHYNQSIRLAPTKDAYSSLGVLYYSTGQFAESAASFRKALDVDPASATTHHNLGDAYERLGKMAEARAEYLEGIARADATLKINMQDVAQLTQKAFCEAKIGRFEDAKRDIATAVTLSHGTDKDALFKSAVIKTLAKDTDGALKDLEAAIAVGYPASAAAEDWDLRSIKENGKFKELVNRK
jgi:tetratricopeptide (TPR) repeat protein